MPYLILASFHGRCLCGLSKSRHSLNINVGDAKGEVAAGVAV